MKGFVVTDFEDMRDQFISDMSGWIREGKIKYRETILEGIDRAPEALIGLLGSSPLSTVDSISLKASKNKYFESLSLNMPNFDIPAPTKATPLPNFLRPRI